MSVKLWKPSIEVRQAFRSLLGLSWPVVGSRLLVQMMALIDTLVVGQYSGQQLGFHMLGITLSWVPAVTGMGLLMGIQVKTAQFSGADESHRIGAVFQRGLGYALLIGLISLIGLWGVGPFILNAMVAPDLLAGAIWPLRLFALGLPAFLVSISVSQFLEGLGRTRDVLIATGLANILNIALVLVLVPGHVEIMGVVINGASGAALATLIARTCLSLALIVWITVLRPVRHLNLWSRQAPDPEGAVAQRRVGYGAGASFFIEVMAFAGMTLFAGHVGAEAVAAWAVVLNFASVVFMVPLGLATGASVLVGRAFGAGQRREVALYGHVSFVVSALFMGGVCVAVWIGHNLIAQFYSHDQALIPVMGAGLLLSCLFFIPDGLQVVAAQALRARGDIMLPTIIHYLCYGVVMLPLGYLLCVTRQGGVTGLVWAVIIASAFSGSAQTGRFIYLDSRKGAKGAIII